MQQKSIYDLAILGAGPAGTCAALRALQLGYRVVILEATAFPRPQIGESLSPGVWNIFDYLEATPLLKHPSYLHGLPAKVIWDSPNPQVMPASQRGPGLIVDRGQLDHDLLALCVQRGATVLQPAIVESLHRETGNWLIQCRRPEGKQVIKAGFVFDARGRKGVPNAHRYPIAPLSVAVWADVSSRGFPGVTLIEAKKEAWLWGSPLPGGQFRIMAYLDPKLVKSYLSPEGLTRLFHDSRLFASAEIQQASQIQTCPVHPFWNTKACKEAYYHLGDSAFSLDPLSSSGVEKAMRFSLQAVIAFNTAVRHGKSEMANTFYREKLLSSVATHARWTADYYGTSWTRSERFWLDRSTGGGLNSGISDPDQGSGSELKSSSRFYQSPDWVDSPESVSFQKWLEKSSTPVSPPSKRVSIPSIIGPLLDRPLTVSGDVTYQTEICVVADHLEMREAVFFPGLEKPIAYLGNIALGPLLQSLTRPVFGAELIHSWTSKYGEPLAEKLIATLFQMKILKEAQHSSQL